MGVMDSELKRLCEWISGQCNGKWEHDYGVTLETCDNPGWILTVDLKGTRLENKPFVPIREGDFSHNCPLPPWIDCHVENGVFSGGIDLNRLPVLLNLFLNWAK